MRYAEFRDLIHRRLKRRKAGMTWVELRDALELPYDRPCPEWTKKLEAEIGLTRVKGPGRALLWRGATPHAQHEMCAFDLSNPPPRIACRRGVAPNPHHHHATL
ncbi:MAG: hypothetical protein AAFY08_08730 [Planctomycetota bacterium]